MRWQHIKTVMIVILFGVNLWMIYLLVGRYTAQAYFSVDVLQNTVDILARDDIHLTVNQIDPRKRDAEIYEAVMSETYFTDVAAIFTDSPINEMFPTPTGVRLTADNQDTISLNNAFGINFLAGGQERKTMEVIAEWAVRAGEQLTPSHFSLRELRSSLEERLIIALTESGTVAPVHAKLSIDAVYRFGDYHLFLCSQEIDGLKLSAHTLQWLCDSAGNLLWLDGTWSFLSLVGNYSAQLYDQINILFIERDTLDALRETESVGPMTVDEIRFCYVFHLAADKETAGRLVYYSPAWQICYIDGTQHTYNAVTGERID